MSKTVFWGLRVSEVLNERARAEAANRGQNLSEFVRYALTSFFDRIDDSRPHNGDRLPPMQDPMLAYGPEEAE